MVGRYFTCCDHSQVKRGPWSADEDMLLTTFIQSFGHENWRALPRQAGLQRCGKSCRLRWINYLKPGVKRGHFTPEEEATIMKLHESLGNKWSKIAANLPGRTDNEIKNVWNTRLKKTLPSHATMKVSIISPSDSRGDHTQGGEEAKDQISPSSLCYNSNDTRNSPVELAIKNADQEQHEVNFLEELEFLSESDYEFWNMVNTLTQLDSIDEALLPLGEEGNINSSTYKMNEEIVLGGEASATRMDYNHEFVATRDASSADVFLAEEDLDNMALAKEEHDRKRGKFYYKSWPSSPFA